MAQKKILLVVALAALILAFIVFDIGRFLSLEYVQAQHHALRQWAEENTLSAAIIYFAVYVLMAALSLPGAAVLTLVGGAVFGLGLGLLLVSFASSIGATLAFLVARFLLRDTVGKRFGNKLAAINRGMEREGAFYVFTLRLVPAFPFFMVNLLLGLTSLRVGVFYIVSQIGMLPGTAVFVNAGTQLGALESLSDVLSPALLGSFVLLGVFPLIARRVLGAWQAKQVYRGWQKPKKFERDLVVIGAGAGGLVSAYIGAAVKAKVTLVEKHRMGGDCLNTGCVPSKALIRTAKFLHHVRRHREFGVAQAEARANWPEISARIQSVVKAIEPHDSVERYEGLGVECRQGHARIVSPWEVEIDGTRVSTRNIIIASGAEPFVPPIPGLDTVDYLTSDTLWNIDSLPNRLVVLGGGPIGTELTQCFARLGCSVTQVEMAGRLLVREDAEVSELVQQSLQSDGVRVLTSTRAVSCVRDGDQQILLCEHNGDEVQLPFDTLLVAVGRKPRTTGFGLEDLGVEVSERGTIAVDDYMRTSIPNIYAVGDVAGPYQFTHTAAHQAWYAAVNALFGVVKRFAVDYRVIPWATFCEPEVARVGLNEQEAKERGIDYEVTRFGIDDLDRAIADSEAHGFVKVLTEPGRDRILGVTIVGEHAGDIIAEYVLAMKHGLGLNKILGTIHTYPTLAEANKYAAGEWKRAHAPARVLQWLERFHRWRRGGE